MLRELTKLAEGVGPKASPEVSNTLILTAARDNDVDVTAGSFKDRSCTSPPGTAEESARGNEVIEAALVAFKGEKRRAGRAHRVLRVTTADRARVSMRCKNCLTSRLFAYKYLTSSVLRSQQTLTS